MTELEAIDGRPLLDLDAWTEEQFFSARCDWCHIEVRNPVEVPHLVKITAEPLPGDKHEWHVDTECFGFLLRLVSRLAVDRESGRSL